MAEVVPLPFMEEATRLLTETSEQAREMPTRDDMRRLNRKTDRNRDVTIAAIALIAIASLVFGYFNFRDLGEISASTAINTGSIQALEEARNELRDAGVPEAELPPPVVIQEGEPVDIDALVSATSATLLARIRTDPAFRGVSGLTGIPGTDGAQGVAGSQGVPGEQGIPGGQGEQGEQGEQGTPGINGADGAPGPTCPRGAAPVLVDAGLGSEPRTFLACPAG